MIPGRGGRGEIPSTLNFGLCGLPVEITAHPLAQVRGGGVGSRLGGLGLMPGWASASSPAVLYKPTEGIPTAVLGRVYFDEIHVIPVRVII